MRSQIINSPGFQHVAEGIARSASAAGPQGKKVIGRLCVICIGLGALVDRGVGVLELSRRELADHLKREPAVRAAGIPVSEEEAELTKNALIVAAAAEKEDASAAQQLGCAWATPIVDSSGDLNVTVAALRLASAAHEQSEIKENEACCTMCGLEGTKHGEMPSPDPLALTRVPLRESCGAGVCSV